MLGADEDDAFFFHPLGEARVLAQKAVARMHRLRAGLLTRGNDFLGLQVAVTTRRRADVDGFIGQLDMACILVGVGLDSDGLDAHLAGSEDDAASDFAAIGYEDFCEHIYFLDILISLNHAKYPDTARQTSAAAPA